jgi:hypothetical protein
MTDYAVIFNSESCVNPPPDQTPVETDTYSYSAVDAIADTAGAECFAAVAYEAGETGCITYTSVIEACASACSDYCPSPTTPDYSTIFNSVSCTNPVSAPIDADTFSYADLVDHDGIEFTDCVVRSLLGMVRPVV